jgi:hypothetical protein
VGILFVAALAVIWSAMALAKVAAGYNIGTVYINGYGNMVVIAFTLCGYVLWPVMLAWRDPGTVLGPLVGIIKKGLAAFRGEDPASWHAILAVPVSFLVLGLAVAIAWACVRP